MTAILCDVFRNIVVNAATLRSAAQALVDSASLSEVLRAVADAGMANEFEAGIVGRRHAEALSTMRRS